MNMGVQISLRLCFQHGLVESFNFPILQKGKLKRKCSSHSQPSMELGLDFKSAGFHLCAGIDIGA
jgi:hypothetical protein